MHDGGPTVAFLCKEGRANVAPSSHANLVQGVGETRRDSQGIAAQQEGEIQTDAPLTRGIGLSTNQSWLEVDLQRELTEAAFVVGSTIVADTALGGCDR